MPDKGPGSKGGAKRPKDGKAAGEKGGAERGHREEIASFPSHADTGELDATACGHGRR